MSKRRHVILSVVCAATALALAAVSVATATGPDPVPLIQAQVRSCTTDSAGYCTVTHTLGVVPDTVLLTPVIPAGATAYTLSAVASRATSTSVRVRAMKSSTNPYANVSIVFSMLVAGTQVPTSTTTSSVTITTTTSTTVPPTTTTASTTTTTPSPSGFPDASNTGVPAGTALTVMTGDLSITTPNTVLDGKDIRGCVVIHATGVVIKNSRISCTGFYVILSSTDASLTIQDSEIDCQLTRRDALADTNITAVRLNIHGCQHGVDMDRTVSLTDSYIHDLENDPVSHTDGVFLSEVARDLTIRHNTIFSRSPSGEDGTAAIISPSVSVGIATNVLVENNLLGGGAYTLYCEQAGPGVNFRVLNNRFTQRWEPTVGAYAPWTDCQDEAQVTGNVYAESGLPVPF